MIKYLMAFLACLGIFILWVLCQLYLAKGILVGIIFFSAMGITWQLIVNKGAKKEAKEQPDNTEEIDLQE